MSMSNINAEMVGGFGWVGQDVGCIKRLVHLMAGRGQCCIGASTEGGHGCLNVCRNEKVPLEAFKWAAHHLGGWSKQKWR